MLQLFWNHIFRILFCLFVCLSVSACVIPVWVDNPVKDKTKRVVLGQTKKSAMRASLGKPIISPEGWNVEVYSQEGTVASFLFGPIFLPAEESEFFYALGIYEDDILVDLETSSYLFGQSYLKSGAFTFDIFSETLCVDNTSARIIPSQEVIAKDNVSNENCSIYLITNYSKSILIDNRYIGNGCYGCYFLINTKAGNHEIKLETNDYGFIKRSISCAEGQSIYYTINKRFGFFLTNAGLELIKSNNPPDDFDRKCLIIGWN